MDIKLYNKVKEMFPDAPEDLIKTMYHNIYGKKLLWRFTEEMNDNSNLNTE